jgi:1,4-dihydroxy-2-naphthoate polyprenyltransferase
MSQSAAPTMRQRVGLGLAARGSVADVVAWSQQARQHDLESVWIHDSYFERDAVTYASAIASQVPEIRVALGALNPFTRHPVLLAMTISAIDEMAPGRVVLGLGTGLPLRLAQMGIPYAPDLGVERVAQAIDQVRALWAGQRLPSATPNLPPVQPMFPPVHRVPIYIAAYRSAFMELCGRKADGYLARPAESIPALELMLEKIEQSSAAAGRPPHSVDVAGYLLSYVDRTRREAVDRAKREPFVIYMISVQSDLAMKRAGFDPELRNQIAAAWRAEDYHAAANLMPDELLHAFILCGTREDVAARVDDYHRAGMDLPIVQPIVQDDEQVREVVAAGVLYGSLGHGSAWVPAAAAAAAPDQPAHDGTTDHRPSLAARLARKAGACYEIVRPFSFTASTVPVATAAALAALNGLFSWPFFLAALLGALLLHIGTNVVNEIYDVRKGIDSITSPRASHALLKGRLTEREAFLLAGLACAGAAAIGLWLILARGWPVAAFGLLGLVGGVGYTAPPFQYKYRALGLPLVFLLMGPLMVVGAYYVITGAFGWSALVASLPVGLLVGAILHGNEWRDISDDARAGIRTFSILAGRRAAHAGYLSLVVGAYIALALAVAFGTLPPLGLLAMLSLPLLVRAIRASELGASGQQRAIAMIDLETAQLHAAFGFLLALGLAMAALTR